jgi:hypothetical protein
VLGRWALDMRAAATGCVWATGARYAAQMLGQAPEGRARRPQVVVSRGEQGFAGLWAKRQSLLGHGDAIYALASLLCAARCPAAAPLRLGLPAVVTGTGCGYLPLATAWH